MSKTIKDMIVTQYRKRFDGVEGAVAVEIRGLDSISTNRMRTHLIGKNVRVTVVKNSLARKAFKGGHLESLNDALAGPTAVVYAKDASVVDVAREIVKWAKGVEKCVFKGACLEGVFYKGKEGVEKLSKLPTRGEALSQAVTIFLSPARKLVGCSVAPGRRILGVVKEIQTRLEKGEAITAKA
ncbi:MAG: 50S ribosomal protein L10 [Phycisphaerales bacterium]